MEVVPKFRHSLLYAGKRIKSHSLFFNLFFLILLFFLKLIPLHRDKRDD